MEIQITKKNGQKLTMLIDDEDYELIKDKTVYMNGDEKCCYPAIWHNGKTIKVHRFIINPGPGKMVDHINQNKMDNRRSNLRTCTKSENLRNKNKGVTNTSGYKGAYRRNSKKGFWRARIHAEKRHDLGNFLTSFGAAWARDIAAMRLHGEFASFNFPDTFQKASSGRVPDNEQGFVDSTETEASQLKLD